MHVRGRAPNGSCSGADRRRPRRQGARDHPGRDGQHADERERDLLILENGTVQRHVATSATRISSPFASTPSTCPALAHDLLHPLLGAGAVPLELAYPPADDPLYKEQPGNFTAELHNRITAALYPLAFLFITFAYLGAPRTTRKAAPCRSSARRWPSRCCAASASLAPS